MPEEAFKPKATLIEGQKIAVDITLAEGIYVYEDSVAVRVDDPASVSIASFAVSATPADHDGDSVYMQKVPVVIALSSEAEGVEPVTVTVDYQGCSEKGLCYEPQQATYTFDVNFSKKIAAFNPAALLAPPAVKAAPAPESSTVSTEEQSETDLIVDTLKRGSFVTVLLLFFGVGLALALTPCVFPMIPILSSIIVSQGGTMTAARGFMLSLVYVLAMASAYAMAGVLAGLFGGNLQAALQNPWAIGSFALIFIALAFSMFGFYEIGLPASLQTRLSRASDEAGQKGGFVGVAVMGFLSALIVGPCVAPGLAAALIYIGQTGDAALGAAALFVMSLGMGVPLLLIGLGAGRFMPRPGGWMTTVTQVFGVLTIGIAIWMLSRILPESVTLLLWALLFMVSAVYMGALEPLEGGRRSWNALFKGLGLVLLLYGALLFTGALTGGKSMVHPLAGLQTAGAHTAGGQTSAKAVFKKIYSLDELDAALEASSGKKVMLDFSAKWCAACKEYEEITFADPAVIAALQDFTLLQADVTENGEDAKALMQRYGLFGPPDIVFFDEAGEVISGKTIIGYRSPEPFLKHLHSLK